MLAKHIATIPTKILKSARLEALEISKRALFTSDTAPLIDDCETLIRKFFGPVVASAFSEDAMIDKMETASGRTLNPMEKSILIEVSEIWEALRNKRHKDQLYKEATLKQLVAAVDLLPIGVLVVDAETKKPILINKVLKQSSAHPFFPSQPECNYLDWIGFNADGTQIGSLDWPLVSAITRGDTVTEREIRIIRSGKVATIELVSAYPIRDSDGKIVAGISTFFDLTEIKQKEAALHDIRYIAEEANRAKSLFLANMSHEIRTPIGIIKGFIDMLGNANVSPEQQKSFLDVAGRNIDHLLKIVDDVLDLSRIEAGRIKIQQKAFSLQQLLADIAETFYKRSKEKGLAFECHVNETVPNSVISDKTKLRQILINLLGNAIKFTAAGKISLDVSLKASSGANPSAWLIFCIKDTGIGIEDAEQDRLFQAFTQTDPSSKRSYSGTGLGLFLSRKFANALGGKLYIAESSPNKGSTFVFSIDIGLVESKAIKKPKRVVKALAPVNSTPVSPSKNLILAGASVLLAEDVEDNQLLIRTVLEHVGANVDIANNGIEAIEKAMKGNYDMLLMDMQMPQMDGFEATATLRSRGYKRPVVALTAHAMKEVAIRCSSVGCDAQLTKPFNHQEFIKTVAYYCKNNKHEQLH